MRNVQHFTFFPRSHYFCFVAFRPVVAVCRSLFPIFDSSFFFLSNRQVSKLLPEYSVSTAAILSSKRKSSSFLVACEMCVSVRVAVRDVGRQRGNRPVLFLFYFLPSCWTTQMVAETFPSDQKCVLCFPNSSNHLPLYVLKYQRWTSLWPQFLFSSSSWLCSFFCCCCCWNCHRFHLTVSVSTLF